MTNEATSPDMIKELITEEGFEVLSGPEANIFHVRDLESGLRITCVVEENILFNTLPCFSAPNESITPAMMERMLASDNGISTSSFQLIAGGDDQTRVALTNFCKLQDLGPEDHDDILSCIDFLFVDVVTARTLLSEYL